MEIEYEQTLEDVIAFNEAHQNRSPLMRSIRLSLFGTAWIAIPIGIVVYFVAAANAGKLPQDPPVLMFLILWGVAHFIVFGLITLRIARTGRSIVTANFLVRRILTEGDTSSLTGRRKLSVSPTTISDSSPSGESSWKMTAVQKILVTEHYAFIYVSPVHAFIVPRRAFFRPEEFERFVKLVEQYSRQTAIA